MITLSIFDKGFDCESAVTYTADELSDGSLTIVKYKQDYVLLL